jgi:hypothetical protein
MSQQTLTADPDVQNGDNTEPADSTAAEGLPPAARDTVYEAYPEVEITDATLKEFFGVDIENPFIIEGLQRQYETIRSLSGAVVGMLQIHRGIDDDILREFYGTAPENLDLTIAHRQQNEQMGVFADPDWRR